MEENYTAMTDDEIERDLMDMVPEDTLTEEERKWASDLAERGHSYEVVKYIKNLHPDMGLKEAKIYYDLYIGKQLH